MCTNLDTTACFALFGAIIRKAIDDYKLFSFHKVNGTLAKNDYHLLKSAKNYLFEKSGLEDYLIEKGFDSLLSIDSIRKEALKPYTKKEKEDE